MGDPAEGALLTLGLKAGLGPVDAAAATPRLDVIPFESEHRFMATLHHDHAGRAFVLLKGAPERVLDLWQMDASEQPLDPKAWTDRMDAAACGNRDRCVCPRQPGTQATLGSRHAGPRGIGSHDR